MTVTELREVRWVLVEARRLLHADGWLHDGRWVADGPDEERREVHEGVSKVYG